LLIPSNDSMHLLGRSPGLCFAIAFPYAQGTQWLKELRKVALTVAGTAKVLHLFPF